MTRKGESTIDTAFDHNDNSPNQAVIHPSMMAKKHKVPIMTGCPRLTVDSYGKQREETISDHYGLYCADDKACGREDTGLTMVIECVWV